MPHVGSVGGSEMCSWIFAKFMKETFYIFHFIELWNNIVM